ncbi:isochorismatase family protein [Hugenholtzia roseola]|uniref:isochorismatase family protein n=1 Tax=Hugenholtzia roseola TaxID=1002 RepID=UPI00047D8D25|nr:isochorismatase family protein [Hugenholtzia roseola]
MRIRKDNTAFILVDVQERLFPHIFEAERLEKKLHTLISGLQILQVPILVSEQYTKGLGKTIESLQPLVANLPTAEKMAFSCYQEERMVLQIERWQANFVILAGIETHVCVLQTALDLLEAGKTPVIVADAVSSRFENDKIIALQRLVQAQCLITTVESLLFELCVKAGTPTFKEISRLVK